MNIRTLALFTTAITSIGWSVSATAQDRKTNSSSENGAPRSTADRVTKRLEEKGESSAEGDIVVVGTRNAIANSIDTK
ncbi:hypothetical protein, partial [uncultured Sphingomonas sp.]